MLKCSVFLGCFGSCEPEVTGSITLATGDYTYKYIFDKVEHGGTITVSEENKLILPNVFTPSFIHTVKLYNTEDLHVETVCFKITTQCKETEL